MKTCPNCKKVYTEELFFCLDDGNPLRNVADIVDPNAPTETAYDVGSSIRTEVITNPVPVPQATVVPSDARNWPQFHSRLPYAAIAVLVLTCIGLAGTLIVLNLDRLIPQRGANSESINKGKTAATPPLSAATSTPEASTTSTVAAPITNTAEEKPPITFNPSGKWSGKWSTPSGSLFDFELTLTENGNNNLDGQVKWTMRRTARPDKANKVGFSALEFVRGRYDPSSGAVNLTGYGKDDPNDTLVMLDVYRLNISKDGRKLEGSARNGGKWNGRVNLSR